MTPIKTAKSWRFLILLIASAVIFMNCSEDAGLVGSSFIESGDSFAFDTIYVDDISQSNFSAFTGRLQRAAIGSYSDAVFGDVSIQTLLKPAIFQENSPIDTIFAGAEMQMRLTFDTLRVWGDTLALSQFNMYEIESNWRGISFLQEDRVDIDRSEVISSFNRNLESSITFDLPQSFIDEYTALYNADVDDKDSLFNEIYRGYIIEPQLSSSNINFLDISSSNLLVTNPGDTVTAEIDIQDWAYTVTRSNQVIPNERLVINSTNDLVLRTNFFDRLESFSRTNILKAELFVFVDTTLLQTTLPANHQRVDVPFLESHQEFDLDPNFDVTFGTSDSLGFRSDSLGAYRFNLTAYVNRFLFGDGFDDDFVLSILERNGLLTGTVLFDETASDALRPKVIITSVVD